MQDWVTLIRTDAFWGGVASSMVASVAIAIIVFVSRSSISAATKRRAEGGRRDDILVQALKDKGPRGNVALAASNARALKQFLIAVFIAYIGDILGIIWPINIFIYGLALVFIWLGLQWVIKVEKSALEMLDEDSNF